MLGYPLKLVMKAIEMRHGREAVGQTLIEAGIEPDRMFRLNVPYDDGEAMRLCRAAMSKVTVDDVGEVFFADTTVRFPAWFAMCKSSREFLELQPEIHNTFAQGLERPEDRSGVGDKFRLEKLPEELVIHYRSANELCDLYRAIARQVFRHYRETASIEEPRCMKRGDDECELRIRWS